MGRDTKKAKSRKSQQQKCERGLSVESAWTGKYYPQKLFRCFLKPFVVSASDVDSDIPIKNLNML